MNVERATRRFAALLLCVAVLGGFLLAEDSPHAVGMGDLWDPAHNGAGDMLGDLSERVGVDLLLDGKAMMDAFRDLTPGDSQYDPDYSPPGSPDVPSSCAGSDGCGECSSKAQHDINFMRFNLEKLRTTCRQAENAADLAMTCKQKYEGMMTGTEKAIREMDRCEAQFFNNRDWYDRYGFLYYQFLRARYEPEK
jgi:hypothetical protein